MPTKSPWKSMDMIESHPPLLEEYLDTCFFAREYSSGQGFGASDCNQLIMNFKKGPEKKQNPHEWKYKKRAIRQFAKELATFLDADDTVAFMPTSKKRGTTEYDDRFDQVAKTLQVLVPGITIIEPIVTRANRLAAHENGERTVKFLRDSFEYTEYEAEVDDGLILIDDVVSAGTHFLAYSTEIRKHHPTLELGGLFWARAV